MLIQISIDDNSDFNWWQVMAMISIDDNWCELMTNQMLIDVINWHQLSSELASDSITCSKHYLSRRRYQKYNSYELGVRSDSIECFLSSNDWDIELFHIFTLKTHGFYHLRSKIVPERSRNMSDVKNIFLMNWNTTGLSTAQFLAWLDKYWWR